MTIAKATYRLIALSNAVKKTEISETGALGVVDQHVLLCITLGRLCEYTGGT